MSCPFLDIQMFQDNTLGFTCTVLVNGSAFDLTGITACTMTAKYRTSDTTYVFQKSIGDGITISAPSTGVIAIQIEPEDTEGLLFGNQDFVMLQYEVRITMLTATYTVLAGNLKVYESVTGA